MNRERVLKLAHFIEEHPEKFHVTSWFSGPGSDEIYDETDWLPLISKLDFLSDHCGTTGCFAGTAIALWPSEVGKEDSFESAGQRILGLDFDEAQDLFYSQIGIINTAEDAVAHLRKMVEEDMIINGF